MVFINIHFFEHGFCAAVLHFKKINEASLVLFCRQGIRQIDLLNRFEIFSNFGKWSIRWNFGKVIYTVLTNWPTLFLGIIHFAFIALAPSGHHWALHICIRWVCLWVIEWLLVPFPTLNWRGSPGGFTMLNRNLHSHAALVLKVSLFGATLSLQVFLLFLLPPLPSCPFIALVPSLFFPPSLPSFFLVSFPPPFFLHRILFFF